MGERAFFFADHCVWAIGFLLANSLSLRIIRALVNSMSVETLRVAEAQSRDANRGIVRMDSRVMRELSLASGDVIKNIPAKVLSKLDLRRCV